jgi:dTDP-4-amino-4,6-dideoxygalactose transaminase
MNYYFPGIIENKGQLSGIKPLDGFTVNSGESAMLLLMRCAGIKKGDKVAIPAFVCNSLRRAIQAVGGIPVYLDLKDDHTCITNYLPSVMAAENCKMVILVHLYGELHPDTKQIEAFCQANHIFLIHDMAQSYGLPTADLQKDFPVVYSFGPGKSTTAAGGALIIWENNNLKNMALPNAAFQQRMRAGIFLSSRVYGKKISTTTRLMEKIVDKFFPASDRITRMSKLQLLAAAYVINKFQITSSARIHRWSIMHKACSHHQYLAHALPNEHTLGFKYIIYAGAHAQAFEQYLMKHSIPFYCLGKDVINEGKLHLPNFNKNATCFFELSCEASIPLQEVTRVAELIAAFAN